MVPQWTKKIVWYQIFPERFRNGEPSNDPDKESLRGAFPHDPESDWHIHPWTSDWYKLQPYEAKTGMNIWSNIQRRRYGGDLQGIIDKLDYLKDLGIGGIYLNPIFTSPSHHKYDQATYHHVDPHFGPNPQKDKELVKTETPDDPATWVWTSADLLFLDLISEVHKRGMRIIIDGVFNHMGLNSWAYQDVLVNQQKSKYRDWFKIKKWQNPKTGRGFRCTTWFGFPELPELNQDENGIVNGPKQYIFNATRRWLDPAVKGRKREGIDGWRLDVAFLVKHPFWKEWRQFVKSIKPEAFLSAEIIEGVDVAKPFLQGDEFDAAMNYNFGITCIEYFVKSKNRITAKTFINRLQKIRDAYPADITYAMQNLVDSHDTNRIQSHIVNRHMTGYRTWAKFFEMSKGWNPGYYKRKGNKYELRIQKLIAIFQMMYVGAPMIYYGDEAGMWGANDPCCRKPMIWDDMEYEDEVYLPDQTKRGKPMKVRVNKDLLSHYKKLIKIRNENPEFQLGDFKPIITDNKKDVIAFERNYKGKKAIVVINNSEDDQRVKLHMNDNKAYTDALNRDVQITNSTEFKIPYKWGRIFIEVRD